MSRASQNSELGNRIHAHRQRCTYTHALQHSLHIHVISMLIYIHLHTYMSISRCIHVCVYVCVCIRNWKFIPVSLILIQCWKFISFFQHNYSYLLPNYRTWLSLSTTYLLNSRTYKNSFRITNLCFYKREFYHWSFQGSQEAWH